MNSQLPLSKGMFTTAFAHDALLYGLSVLLRPPLTPVHAEWLGILMGLHIGQLGLGIGLCNQGQGGGIGALIPESAKLKKSLLAVVPFALDVGSQCSHRPELKASSGCHWPWKSESNAW